MVLADLGLSLVDEVGVRSIRDSGKDIIMSSASHVLVNDSEAPSDVQYETICDCVGAVFLVTAVFITMIALPTDCSMIIRSLT